MNPTFTMLTTAALAIAAALGQPSGVHDYVAIDTWRTRPGQHDRYLAFLDSNWAPARREASRLGFVTAYRAIVLDSVAAKATGWDVMLTTTYRDSASWENREALFQPIIARRGLIRIEGYGPRDLSTFVWETHGRSR